MDSTYRITLDTQAAGSQVTLQCKKGDVGRKIEISLVQAGSPFQLPEGAYAVLMAHKPDDHILYNYAQIDGGKIVYKMTAQTTAAAGTAQCEIRLYSSAGEVLTTARFDLLIDEAVYSDAQVQSADEFTALTDLVAQVMDLLERIGITVRAVNGRTPNDNGVVNIFADDINTQQESWHFEGNLADALDDLHDVLTYLIVQSVAGMITSVNGKAGTDGAVTLNSDDIPMVDGQWDWGGFTLTEAMDDVMNSIPSSTIINSMIIKLIKDYVKTVNGVAPGEDGNVLLESDDIRMSEGAYDTVTEALMEVNSSIPDKTVIDGYIDAKLAQLPAPNAYTDVTETFIESGIAERVDYIRTLDDGMYMIHTAYDVSYYQKATVQYLAYLRETYYGDDSTFVDRCWIGDTVIYELDNNDPSISLRCIDGTLHTYTTSDKAAEIAKATLCDSTAPAWTDAEQAAARERIGIKSTEGVLF